MYSTPPWPSLAASMAAYRRRSFSDNHPKKRCIFSSISAEYTSMLDSLSQNLCCRKDTTAQVCREVILDHILRGCSHLNASEVFRPCETGDDGSSQTLTKLGRRGSQTLATSCLTLRRRHAKRLESRVRTAGAGLEAFQVGARVGAREIQDLASEVPVFLDLRFRLCGAACQLAVLSASRSNGACRSPKSGGKFQIALSSGHA
jgi:hypothetical protein